MVRDHDFDAGLTGPPRQPVRREVEGGADPAVLDPVVPGRPKAMSPSEMLKLQRLAGNAAVGAALGDENEEPSPVHEVITSGDGVPLDSSTRSLMETRLGHDFSDVRVNTGPKADESARSVNAQAYTVGANIVFQSGKYAPGTSVGLQTLAHELTHVVQQKAGPVAGTPAPGGIRVSDPSDTFEQAAERISAEAVAGIAVPAAATAETAVQRDEAGEEELEEEVQTLATEEDEVVEQFPGEKS